jgi:hypothetical protein
MRPSLLLALAVAGCAGTDPLTRAGVWHPNGANRANLEAMAANPADLRAGHGSATADGDLAAAAVARLRQGRVRPLPQSGIAELHLQGGEDAAPPDLPPPAAPGPLAAPPGAAAP